MRIALERRRPPLPRPRLLHVVAPRTNAAAITAAVNLLGALRAAEPFSLELAADDGMRWFLARAGSPAASARLGEQLAAAYPQAAIEPLDTDRHPGLDPARPRPDDPRLVREKIGPPAFRAQLRLTVFAPADAPSVEIEERLRALAGAYGQFDLAAGNGLDDRSLSADGAGLLAPRALRRAVSILNVRELAGMWHLPQGGAEARYLPRTTARRRPPLPCTVADGCPIGVEHDLGRVVPIAVSDALLGKHMLLVAKTGRGKSTLMLHLAEYLMAQGTRALMAVDPHRDLAGAVLGRVPPGRADGVVHLDVGAAERPFGLNLLDVGLGWSRDKAVDNAIQIFKREFDRFWGPRMEDAFVHALATLYEANRQRQREEQFTLLDVPPLLSDGAFRLAVLKAHAISANLEAWWTDYFNRLDPRLQLEIINPVLTKIHRYSGNEFARRIVGQPRSTIDPAAWLAERKIVVVDTNKAAVGENTAALVGATLLNLTALVVGAQARLDRAERPRVTILVDEFQTMPGADYEAILSELAKYGANLVLATQSLARLDALDREHQRALKAMVFSNIDALFAFHVSAEDARYLVDELDEAQAGVPDLVSLGEHRCYARLSAGPERLEVFSVELAAPERPDEKLRDRLVQESADRYGRARADVDLDLERALKRVRDSHGSRATDRPATEGGARDKKEDAPPEAQDDAGGIDGEGPGSDGGDGGGAPGGAPAPRPGPAPTSGGAAADPASRDPTPAPDPGPPRNWRRNRRGPPDGAGQASFLDAEGLGEAAE